MKTLPIAKRKKEKMKRERKFKEGEVPEDFEKNIRKALDFDPKRNNSTGLTPPKVKKKKKK